MAKIPDDELEVFPVVPQSVLKECLRLQNRLDFLRGSVRKSLDEGHAVEEGDLTAKLVTSMRGTPPWKAELEKIIGKDKIKEIQAATPKSPSVSLKIDIKKQAILKRDELQ
jgi:hypothetical protein